MTTTTTARTISAVLAVPAFVLLQGYRDVRARLLQGGDVVLDVTNQITTVGVSSTAWTETLLGVLLAGAVVALVAPRRGRSLSRSLPLLVATALLAAVLTVGMAITDPPNVQDRVDLGAYASWTYWVRTGVHGPAAPALLGVLLVLCARATRGTHRARPAAASTPATIVRALAVVVAVPVLVLVQGYLDVRAESNADNVVLDASTTRVTDLAEASPTWLEALLTLVLAGALVALVLTGRGPTALRVLPLLVATALLAVVVVLGQSVVEPARLQAYLEDGDPEPVWFWARTGFLSPVMPLLLGALLALATHAGWTTRERIRHPDRTTT